MSTESKTMKRSSNFQAVLIVLAYTIFQFGFVSNEVTQQQDNLAAHFLRRKEYVSTSTESFGKMTIDELLPGQNPRVGRVDYGQARYRGSGVGSYSGVVTLLPCSYPPDSAVYFDHVNANTQAGQSGRHIMQMRARALHRKMPACETESQLECLRESFSGNDCANQCTWTGTRSHFGPTANLGNTNTHDVVVVSTHSSSELGFPPLLPAQVYTKPADIASATDEQKADVVGFTIGKTGYGEIAFDIPSFNTTDVRHIDLRYSLVWEGTPGHMTSVTLYPDQATKPPQGVALNKPATVSVYFNRVGWSMERIISIVEAQEDTTFVSYNSFTKLLRFQVSHFSTYGFKDIDTPQQSHWEAPALSPRRLQAWSGGHC